MPFVLDVAIKFETLKIFLIYSAISARVVPLHKNGTQSDHQATTIF